jgi:predicted permease
MDILNILWTIIPIFLVIILGWLARWKGFIQQDFLQPANRLVYYLAIPALIFRAISKAPLKSHFDVAVLIITLFSVLAVFALAWVTGYLLRIRSGQLGTFMQSTFHGNLGYIGLAVAFYLLGNKGFVSASIIAGFLMILQNFLAVISLQFNSDQMSIKGKTLIALRILGNPVIISAISGILFSLSGLTMPLVVDRSLNILGGLALPMALLIIGASLSFRLMQSRMLRILFSSFLKLMVLPAAGLLLYRLFGLAPREYLPALILLASPSATITYVMAREMGGDADFAVAAISASTLMSSVTFTMWINIAGA